MNDYQIYCLTHPTNDPAELTNRLFEQHRMSYNKLNQQKEIEQIKREIIAEILKQIRIEISNNASPTIKEIQKDIENLFSK